VKDVGFAVYLNGRQRGRSSYVSVTICTGRFGRGHMIIFLANVRFRSALNIAGNLLRGPLRVRNRPKPNAPLIAAFPFRYNGKAATLGPRCGRFGDVTLATATAIQNAIARHYRAGNHENPQVGIVCLSLDEGCASNADDWRWILESVHAHHGAYVEDIAAPRFAVFPVLVEAIGFAKALQRQFAKRIRIGVNLGAFAAVSNGDRSSGTAYAEQLMDESGPGEMCVSALAGNRLTSRIRDDQPQSDLSRWRSCLSLFLQWGGLIGYFAGWAYLIYLKFSYFAEHGTHFCAPEWLCK